MAIITRRYVFTGPSNDDLTSAVSSTATSLGPASISVDVQFDDTVPGTQEALDQFMAEEWLTPSGNSPPTQTTLFLRSPNGTLFRIEVDNLGNITATPTA